MLDQLNMLKVKLARLQAHVDITTTALNASKDTIKEMEDMILTLSSQIGGEKPKNWTDIQELAPSSPASSQGLDMRSLEVLAQSQQFFMEKAVMERVPDAEEPTLENPVPKEPPVDVNRNEMLNAFFGRRSVLCKYLSPSVLTFGRGFLAPGVHGLQQYTDDVAIIMPSRLTRWPTGFYRSKATMETQFFLRMTTGYLLLTSNPLKDDRVPLPIPMEVATHWTVLFMAHAPDNEAQWKDVTTLSSDELVMVIGSMEEELKRYDE